MPRLGLRTNSIGFRRASSSMPRRLPRGTATEGSPLDDCDCPVLQVALANSSRALWETSQRGLGAADLAMHVVLPELDGRLFAGVISFKEEDDLRADLGVSLVRHAPYEHGIEHVADLAAAWAKLRAMPRGDRRVGLLLSTYPGRPDQIAHAVGLDGLESTCKIASRLQGGRLFGFRSSDRSLKILFARLETNGHCDGRSTHIARHSQSFRRRFATASQPRGASRGRCERQRGPISDSRAFLRQSADRLAAGTRANLRTARRSITILRRRRGTAMSRSIFG